MEKNKPEVWQRGPVENVPFLLQPVAHAILQAREEVEFCLQDFPQHLLWEKPAGMASVGFHLLHMTGVLDRLFTYAEGKALGPAQLDYLKSEASTSDPEVSVSNLVRAFHYKVSESIRFLEKTSEESLWEPKYLGRAKIPTNKLGLLFHAAEHTQRHLGQLLVTGKILKAGLK